MSGESKKIVKEVQETFKEIVRKADDAAKKVQKYDGDLANKIQRVKHGAGEVAEHIEKRIDPHE